MGYASGFPVRPLAGRLALDFVNTANWREDGSIVAERLETVADLTAWAEALGLGASQPPADIASAVQFRAELRSMFLGGKPPASLDLVRGFLSLDEKAAPGELTARQPLMPLIAASAIAVMADGRETARLKTCAGPNCGWLFIDETAAGRRQWCSMKLCGNRAKAARHYARQRGGDPSD